MKPESLRREDLVSNLYAAINEAQLAAYIVRDALREVLSQVETAVQQQIQRDIAAYNEAIAQEAYTEEITGEE